MAKSPPTAYPNNLESSVWTLLAFILGLLVGILLMVIWVQETHAQQSLLWPTPEVDGTVRDLTHLPALPQFEVDPSNLQHQAWGQPGSAMAPESHTGVVFSPEYPAMRSVAADQYHVPVNTPPFPKNWRSIFEMINHWHEKTKE